MWKLPRRTQQRFRYFKVWHGADHWGENNKTDIFVERPEKERSSCEDTLIQVRNKNPLPAQ